MVIRRIHGKRERGVAIVEFALILPVLALLFGGMAELGHAIYQYESLTKGARNAARYLSEFSAIDPSYPLAAAKCLAVYGTTDCTGTPIVNNLSVSNVVVCDRNDSSGCPGGTFLSYQVYDATNNDSSDPTTLAGSVNLVEVKITGYAYSPLQSIFNLSGLTFGDVSVVMRQVL